MDAQIAVDLGVPLELRRTDVVRYMSGRPLDFNPGSKAVYSNYGYLLAGQIIEKVSGKDYPTFVQEQLFDPIGISRIGQGSSVRKRPNEVDYSSTHTGPTVLDNSGAMVPAPYGTFSMHIHEANGAWTASAVDIARWTCVFDQPSELLSRTTLDKVWARPETGLTNGSYFGLGWQIRPINAGTGRIAWHAGTLPGTSTLMVRSNLGANWVVLFNQRDDPSGLSYSDIDGALWDACHTVRDWPTHDLFPDYQ